MTGPPRLRECLPVGCQGGRVPIARPSGWGWHGRCLGISVQDLQPSPRVPLTAPPAARSIPARPFGPPIAEGLARLGVGPRPLPGEDADLHRARTETALMALFRDRPGEEEFEALYRFTEPSLRRWIRLALGPRSERFDPQELVQDAFVNIYRYAGGFRDEHPASFRSWAQAVCRNVVRRGRLRPRSATFSQLPPGVPEPADGRVGPLQQASEVEQRRALAGALVLLLIHYAVAYARLSPRDRLALRLVELEGLSYVEAGERLRVGISNMKMIMFRARRRVRALMARAMGLEATASAARAAG